MERTRKQLRKSKPLAGGLALVFLLAASAAVHAAAPPESAPAARPAEVATAIPAAAPATVKPEAAALEIPDYRYDSRGKTDPFKPFVRLELPTPRRRGRRRRSTPET